MSKESYVVKRKQIASGATLPTANAGEMLIVFQDGVQYNIFPGEDPIAIKEPVYEVQIQGRFNLNQDGITWVTWSDVIFGTNIESFDLAAGTGAVPDVNWQSQGVLFPKGAVLKRILVKGRANSNEVDDIEFLIRAHDADFSLGLPIDNASEVGAVTVASGTLDTNNGGTGDNNDMHLHEIDLANYEFNNHGDLHFLVRPGAGSTLTTNRQWRCSILIQYTKP